MRSLAGMAILWLGLSCSRPELPAQVALQGSWHSMTRESTTIWLAFSADSFRTATIERVSRDQDPQALTNAVFGPRDTGPRYDGTWDIQGDTLRLRRASRDSLLRVALEYCRGAALGMKVIDITSGDSLYYNRGK